MVLGAQVLRDRPGRQQIPRALGTDRERRQPLTLLPGHLRRDRRHDRRVQTPGEEHPHRDVAHHVPADRVREHVTDVPEVLLGPLLVRRQPRRAHLDRHRVGEPDHRALGDVVPGDPRGPHVPGRERLHQRLVLRVERAQLAGEDRRPPQARPVQRLDPDRIPRHRARARRCGPSPTRTCPAPRTTPPNHHAAPAGTPTPCPSPWRNGPPRAHPGCPHGCRSRRCRPHTPNPCHRRSAASRPSHP